MKLSHDELDQKMRVLCIANGYDPASRGGEAFRAGYIAALAQRAQCCRYCGEEFQPDKDTACSKCVRRWRDGLAQQAQPECPTALQGSHVFGDATRCRYCTFDYGLRQAQTGQCTLSTHRVCHCTDDTCTYNQ